LRQYVRPGALCVDVGAHLGYFTILMARIAGPSGRVVAFEAFPDTFRTLEENIAMNRLENVVLEPRAVSDAPGTISLVFERRQRYSGTPSTVAYAVEGESDTLDVPAVSLDAYFRQLPGLPGLIKIDVEGAEFSVLSGARETLARTRQVLLVKIHGRESQRFDRVNGFLRDCGCRVTVLGMRKREAFCLAPPLSPAEEKSR
jgi:FkbM family methyltransferase